MTAMYLTDLKPTQAPVTLPDGWVHYYALRNGVATYALHNTFDDLWMEYNQPVTAQVLTSAKVTLTKTKKG